MRDKRGGKVGKLPAKFPRLFLSPLSPGFIYQQNNLSNFLKEKRKKKPYIDEQWSGWGKKCGKRQGTKKACTGCGEGGKGAGPFGL